MAFHEPMVSHENDNIYHNTNGLNMTTQPKSPKKLQRFKGSFSLGIIIIVFL